MMTAACWRSLRRLSSSGGASVDTLSLSSSASTPRVLLRKVSSMPLFISTDVEMIAANHRQTTRITTKKSAAAAAASPPSTSLANTKNRCSYSTTVPVASNEASSSSSSTMKDEYGAMDDSGSSFTVNDFQLESGRILPTAELRYQTYGTLNEKCDNVIVVCHALTGNASLHSWWGDLLGSNRAFDTDKYFVVCCNILGSCYGSTSPVSINPATGQPYGMDFPDVSVQDTVRLQLKLLHQELQVESVKSVIGGSFGGMQAVEFAVQGGFNEADFTDSTGAPFVRSVIPIACGAQHTAWQIAVSEVQRQAIYKDPAWSAGDPSKATAGLEVARQLGMISYRTPTGYTSKFGRRKQSADSPEYGSAADWQVKNYLKYQGQKFLSRFDPVTYVKLTEQMDSHDVARGRGDSAAAVLRQVTIPALVLGIDSDVLYPIQEQKDLADMLPNSTLAIIHSEDGHDGFLLEQEQVAKHIADFLERHV